MNGTAGLVTLDELDAVLNAPRSAPTPSVDAIIADLDINEVCEIAAKCDERGMAETINGLLEALRVRHGDDDTTLAILAALEQYHVPTLLDCMKV